MSEESTWVMCSRAIAGSVAALALLCASARAQTVAPAGGKPAPFDEPRKWTPVDIDHGPDPAATAQPQRDPLAPLDEPEQSTDTPSPDATRLIAWIASSGDNNDLPYMVIDKVAAEVFIFDSGGELIASSPVLVGISTGDESEPFAGDRELSHIPLAERTTPAGRFVAKFGHAAGGRDVLWVDYQTAISLHAVITTNKKEHRLERLNSPTPEDNRITFGCINVPTRLYAKVVKPLFKGTSGIVYILPETKPLNAVFLALPPDPSAPAAARTAQ